jgi:hypothetical protein
MELHAALIFWAPHVDTISSSREHSRTAVRATAPGAFPADAREDRRRAHETASRMLAADRFRAIFMRAYVHVNSMIN